MGALVVVLIALLSKSKAFYIAGLVPLFPTFALIAHVIVASDQGAAALQKTALFGIWSLIPYFIYLLMVYVLATRLSPRGMFECGNHKLDNCRSGLDLYLAKFSSLKMSVMVFGTLINKTA